MSGTEQKVPDLAFEQLTSDEPIFGSCSSNFIIGFFTPIILTLILFLIIFLLFRLKRWYYSFRINHHVFTNAESPYEMTTLTLD